MDKAISVYIWIYIHLLSLSKEKTYKQVEMNISSIWISVSKYHFQEEKVGVLGEMIDYRTVAGEIQNHLGIFYDAKK